MELKFRHGFVFIGVNGKANSANEKMAINEEDEVQVTQVYQLSYEKAPEPKEKDGSASTAKP